MVEFQQLYPCMNLFSKYGANIPWKICNSVRKYLFDSAVADGNKTNQGPLKIEEDTAPGLFLRRRLIECQESFIIIPLDTEEVSILKKDIGFIFLVPISFLSIRSTYV